jgi:hypothetical protein
MTRIPNAAGGFVTLFTFVFLTSATPGSANQGKAKGHEKHPEKHEQKKEKKQAAKAKASTDESGLKFQGVDRDNDGVITRAEWRGSDMSFANRDWNRDGVLSGDEMKPGAVRPAVRRSAAIPSTPRTTPAPRSGPDPDGPVFARLDANHDGVLTRTEWPDDRFSGVDFNGDGVLSAYEYGVGR